MLVHANRHFLRPCQVMDGRAPTRHLAHYAVDLVRLGSGQWHVLADHTEVPSGIGYALEMRRVLARSLPEAFRSIPVRHLRPFVDRWHDSLLAMAPGGVRNPNMAVLTPGSLSATYFEHVYLSRMLGVPLVEGGDLVARDGEVSIKTLAGLRPVHVLLRRLDSAFVDPLELRADSALGITGMVETTRSGKITLANALGSGVVETPALMPFLERLSDHLLGEPLSLPSLDVWWLGEPAALAFALANLDLMIVRRCLGADREPIVVGMLEPAERKAFEAEIRAQPGQFVAQYPVTPSLSPKWDGTSLAPAAVVMRVFVSADGDGYRVLPGGLAREPAGDTCLRSLGRLNGTLKDVWVLAEDAADVQVPSTRRFHQLAVERGGADLQSRVADNLYWLGRYIERLDNDARLLRTTATKVAPGAVSPRDAIELRLLGRLLSQADLMDQCRGAVGAGECRLPAGPWRRRHRRSRPDHRARCHPAADQLDARPLLRRHDHGGRSGDGRGAPAPDGGARQSRSAAGRARRDRALRRHPVGPRPGEHDARHGLAFPRSRTTAGAGAVRGRPARWGLSPSRRSTGMPRCGWRSNSATAPSPTARAISASSSPRRCSISSCWTTAIRARSSSSFAPSRAISTISRASRACVCRRFPSRSTRTSTPPCASSPATSRCGATKDWRLPCCATSRPIPISKLDELSEAITRAYFCHVPAAQAVGSSTA